MSASKRITIVGGGLAGLTLGIGLRQRGVPVTIWEAGGYPRHRVCGEFISGNGIAVLKRLGLFARLEQAGAVCARTAMFVRGTRCSPIRQLATPALCLSRYKMDALLAETFQQLGGELLTHRRWTSAEFGEGAVCAAGRRVRSTDHGLRWFGVKAHIARSCPVSLDADLEMHISQHGYVGVSRISAGEINVCGLFRARPANSPPESKLEWLRGECGSLLHERLNPAQFEEDSFCSVAGLSLKPQRAATQKECRIGDALTMTPPVTGNGMSMAFESAELAVEPLAAYSRSQLHWAGTRKQIAFACDAAFSRRLTWARILQYLMMAPAFQGGPGFVLLNTEWVWQLMVAKTR